MASRPAIDENKGAVAPQDHVLPPRVVVPRPAGFAHVQEASRTISHMLPSLAYLLIRSHPCGHPDPSD